MINVACVKSSSYQDLWITPITSDAFSILKTTLMRTPQIGLLEQLKTDFIIVKESQEEPCQKLQSCISAIHMPNLKYSKTQKNPDSPFLDEKHHNHTSIDSISVDVESIEWSKYNIVLTINACIPNRIIEQYPKILWCYYIGENNNSIDNLIDKYDVVLNQDVMRSDLPKHSIGFPYSFLGPTTIEDINKKTLQNSLLKRGIFMEINNTKERPVKTVPLDFIEISEKTNSPIIIHNQDIIENIKGLYAAKYYVKLFGRTIRGNSVLEAISAGTLILANKNKVTYSNLILDNCHVENSSDVISKIQYYDSNPEEYNKMILSQRAILKTHYFVGPINNLIQKYKEKCFARF